MRFVVSLLIALLTLVAAGPAAASRRERCRDRARCSNSFSVRWPTRRAGDALRRRPLPQGGQRCRGINGRKVRTVYYDDGYKPRRPCQHAQARRADKILAVIAPQGRHRCGHLEYLEENKVRCCFRSRARRSRAAEYVFSGMTLYDGSRDDDRLPRRPAEVQDVGVLYQDDDYGKAFLTLREGPRAPQLKIAAPSREARRQRRERSDRQIARGVAQVTFLVLTPAGAQALKEREKIGWTTP